MFDTKLGILGFVVGVGLTVGMLLTPHLVPGGRGYQTGLTWSWWTISWVLALGGAILAATLFLAGKTIKDAASWKEPRVIIATAAIVLIANTLYMFLIEWFGLHSGWRAIIAVAGVPVIYGNLGRVLGKTTLGESLKNILIGALATMGAGFILAAIIRGW